MKRQLNIVGPLYKYKYLVEYNKSNIATNTTDIHWCNDGDDIRLLLDDTKYYRKYNDWHNRDTINSTFNHTYIPKLAHISNIKVFIPDFAAHIHTKGIKYVITLNTWVNGMRIDLGSFIFRPTDAKAIETGPIKQGNYEYFEYVSFDIIDPYYLMFSDEWADFRANVCLEPKNINSTPSSLYVSFYVVNEYENRYIQNSDFVGSCNNFIVADFDDSLRVDLKTIQEPKLGLRFDIHMNPEYDWLLSYIKETYNLNVSANDIIFNVIIKRKDAAVVGPTVTFNVSPNNSSKGHCFQDIYWGDNGLESFKLFFSSWNDFEEGWYFVGSMTIANNFVEDGEVYEENNAYTLFTNDLIITQELYSIFANGGSEKVDMSNLIVPQISVINKLTHEITTIDRPVLSINDTKSLSNLPVRIKRPNKFNIHKTYTVPLIKMTNQYDRL
jgi:hypothetical protein